MNRYTVEARVRDISQPSGFRWKVVVNPTTRRLAERAATGFLGLQTRIVEVTA